MYTEKIQCENFISILWFIVDQIIYISWFWFIGRVRNTSHLIFFDWCNNSLGCFQNIM
jgi:hypothetical protein